MDALDAAETGALQRKLLRWYDKHRRDLPWRRCPRDVYRQWVAETMLQQTQVATVVPYFNRFMARFPTVRHLAGAPADKVLAAWAGLGYYARARHLHQAARVVADKLDGDFPRSAADLQELPGIGRYTAGAIASIAFGERAPVLDGNVKRVLARLLKVATDIRQKDAIDALWTAAEKLLPSRRCGDFNQALMELGATVCTPKKPACSSCPVSRECRAFAAGIAEKLPRTGPRRTPSAMQLVVAALQEGNRYLIRRRPPGSLWGGLWELPTAEMNGPGTARSALVLLLRHLWPDASAVVQIPPRASAVLTHRLTHRTVQLRAYRCRGGEGLSRRRLESNCRWVIREELGDHGFARAHRRVMETVFPELKES